MVFVLTLVVVTTEEISRADVGHAMLCKVKRRCGKRPVAPQTRAGHNPRRAVYCTFLFKNATLEVDSKDGMVLTYHYNAVTGTGPIHDYVLNRWLANEDGRHCDDCCSAS